MISYALATVAGLCLIAPSAQALCSYNGVDNAKTTVAQEFKDSRWVVRAHVVSAYAHWSGKEAPWVTYRVKVIKSFKGHLASSFTFFSMRDSGGFYLERPYTRGPDTTEDYLLFLIPYPYDRTNPRQSWKALFVNYACGQSKAWPKVSVGERKELQTLSARTP